MRYWLIFLGSFWLGALLTDWLNESPRFENSIRVFCAIVTGITILYLLGLGIGLIFSEVRSV